MKEDISQLVDARGRRPASNQDAIKLYSFSASLPMYRRKYDWKVPVWSSDSVKCLHMSVRKELTTDIATGPGGLDSNLDHQQLSQAAHLFKTITVRTLYATYLSYGIALMKDATVALIKSDDFPTIMNQIVDNPESFEGIFAKVVEKCVKEHQTDEPNMPPARDDYDLGALWARIADQVNLNSKSAKNKIASECWAIFLNSTCDGDVIRSVSKQQVKQVHELLSNKKSKNSKLRYVDIANELGLTPYQVLKAASIPEATSNARWSEEEDERLLQFVQRQENAHTSGVKRSSAICWKTVSRHMGNKTNEQCRLRWRTIAHSTLRDYPFEDHQLYMLQILHTAYGDNWQKIANLIPGKLAHQCRTKFLSALSQPDREEYVKYYMDLKNAIANKNPSINVRKCWCRIDWLGMRLLKIASLTKNAAILIALHEFYGTEEIERRISMAYTSRRLKKGEDVNGFDVFILSEYLMKTASQMVRKIVNSAVEALLKRSRMSNANDFKSMFEVDDIDDNQFLQSLRRLLRSAWP
ncbi:hypothetical protein BgAZ_205130 [Babesia gibsoni]|uniref:Myb-like DNA-binding domain containing protein n=1 Tax=Babesia gibsoni TaxID=33632 RepID=A0AAD8LS32_BABGI|nr:hypothetical protein BgAZ_205130 [Babesia gibsoni]